MSTMDALEKVAKWRAHFTGWQLGTRRKGDPAGDAVRDHREVTIMLRVESNAVAALLIRKGVFTHEEFVEQLGVEAAALDQAYERSWPGAKATPNGMSYDLASAESWMSRWPR